MIFWKWKLESVSPSVMTNSFSTPWTAALQPPLSMEFSKQEYWSGYHSLFQGIFPTWGLNQISCIAGKFFTIWATREAWGLPGSSVHGIFQARILEKVTIPFSRCSSQPRDWARVSCLAGRFFIIWATREAHRLLKTHWKIITIAFCWRWGFSIRVIIFKNFTVVGRGEDSDFYQKLYY